MADNGGFGFKIQGRPGQRSLSMLRRSRSSVSSLQASLEASFREQNQHTPTSM